MSDIVYKKDDLSKTSYGLGHNWRPETRNLNVPTSLDNPLPNELKHVTEVLAEDHFQTTSKSFHNMKYSKECYGNETFSKPQAHYKVHYNRDLHEKLQAEKSRRPLTMANQLSETKEEFALKRKIFEPNTFTEYEGFQLKDHLNQMSESKKNAPLKAGGNSINSICWLNDPYVTTYQKEHRMFDSDEVHYATQKLSSVDPVMVSPQEVPMRDRIPFKAAVQIRNVPQKANILPHTGMKTDYQENFESLHNLYDRTAQTCPPPDMKMEPKSADPTTYVPHFYKTEYQNIGSKCRQAV